MTNLIETDSERIDSVIMKKPRKLQQPKPDDR